MQYRIFWKKREEKEKKKKKHVSIDHLSKNLSYKYFCVHVVYPNLSTSFLIPEEI